MKIGIIVRKLNSEGGVQRQALALAHELAMLGEEVTLYTFSYSKKDCFPDLIGDIEVLPLPAKYHRRTTGFFGFLNEAKMAKDLARLMPGDLDIINPHDAVSHYVAHYYKKRFKNTPSVWYMCELPTMRWPIEYLEYAENPAFHDIPYRPYWFKKMVILLKTRYENIFIRSQDAIAVMTTYHKNLLKKYAGRESTIVPSGVDADRFPFVAREAPKKGERLLLLSSGVFTSYRRFEDILPAVKKLVEWGYDPYLEVLGGYTSDPTYHRALTALASRLEIFDRVKFSGRYLDEELLDKINTSHVFVYPHLQSQGLAAYEAMVAGLPVVVTPLLGTYENLTHKKHAILVEPKNPDMLAGAIKELIDDPILYEKLSVEGAEHIRNNFIWSRYAREMLAVFHKVLKK